MGVKKFEDLVAWNKAQDLAVNIYSKFRDLKDFGFKDQIQRAAISVSNNIAEGFDRKTNADFSRFLYIAISSASEVKSMLYLSVRLDYLNTSEVKTLVAETNEVSMIIRGLIKSLNPKT